MLLLTVFQRHAFDFKYNICPKLKCELDKLKVPEYTAVRYLGEGGDRGMPWVLKGAPQSKIFKNLVVLSHVKDHFMTY